MCFVFASSVNVDAFSTRATAPSPRVAGMASHECREAVNIFAQRSGAYAWTKKAAGVHGYGTSTRTTQRPTEESGKGCSAHVIKDACQTLLRKQMHAHLSLPETLQLTHKIKTCCIILGLCSFYAQFAGAKMHPKKVLFSLPVCAKQSLHRKSA